MQPEPPTVMTTRPVPPPAARRRRSKGRGWLFMLTLVALVGLGGAAYVNPRTRPYVDRVIGAVKNFSSKPASGAEPSTSAPADEQRDPNQPWDQLVKITPEQEEAVGLKMYTVKNQKKPIELALNGTTAYDANMLSQIRVRFDSLVTQVFKTLGDPVKKGDALVELYSNELAKAKNQLQVNYVQWLHDKRLKESRQKLYQDEAISRVQMAETINSEARSYLEYRLAEDNLKVFGLSPEEISPLLANLNEESMPSLAANNQNIADKASFILRSPADGFIIKRDVVKGTYYEPSSVLMVIAPLDHLRVYANVYESDIELVQKGQTLVVQFPFQDRVIETTVDNISNQVDPDTHAMRVRATIQNPHELLKSDMLVHAVLQIPAYEGDTHIPRNALVTTNDKFYVFVRKPRHDTAGSAKKATLDTFERREIRLRQERSDEVIVCDGLQEGEEIATSGSLILAQMYEDLATIDTGMPSAD